MFPHRGNAEGDVFFQRNAEFFGSLDYVFAVDAARKGFVLQAFLHGTCFQIKDTFRWANIRAGGDEACELVASEEGVFESGLPRNVAVVGVRQDGADHFLGIAKLAEDSGTFGGVLAVGRVVAVGPALVVEVMEERGESPTLLILALLAGVGTDAGFDSKHMLAEGLGLSVLAEQFPGIVTCRHAGSSAELNCYW